MAKQDRIEIQHDLNINVSLKFDFKEIKMERFIPSKNSPWANASTMKKKHYVQSEVFSIHQNLEMKIFIDNLGLTCGLDLRESCTS